ncbi:hypothetical protein Q8G48_28445, partial [Klebsiella pneumoniae]|uniref:hypothetical protein n=1 Tax=Klebsiella pneumoniae TaxID=573 RepID=UPI0030133246
PLEDFMREQHGPGLYEIPGEAVRSVILGSRIDAETEGWLRALVARMRRGVAIRQASLAGDGRVTIS